MEISRIAHRSVSQTKEKTAVNKTWIGFRIGLLIWSDSGSDWTGIFAFGVELLL